MATEGTVVVMEQGDSEGDAAEFWEIMEGDMGDIAEADEEDELVEEFVPTLFRLDAAGGEATEVAQGEPIKIGWAKASPRFLWRRWTKATSFCWMPDGSSLSGKARILIVRRSCRPWRILIGIARRIRVPSIFQ